MAERARRMSGRLITRSVALLPALEGPVNDTVLGAVLGPERQRLLGFYRVGGENIGLLGPHTTGANLIVKA